MKTTADIMEMLSADFTTEYFRYMTLQSAALRYYDSDMHILAARRMQMISLAAIMIYDGRW